MFRRFRKHPISCTGDLLIMNMIKIILVSGHSNFEVAGGVALLLLPTTCLLLPTLDLGHVLLAKRMTLDQIDSQRKLVCFYSTRRMFALKAGVLAKTAPWDRCHYIRVGLASG